jgi:5-methylcytosine-specific restriction endonuclease McrA
VTTRIDHLSRYTLILNARAEPWRVTLSRNHHVDRLVPLAKGGSSTADNLQVMEWRKNLAKGSESPWWDLLGREGWARCSAIGADG